MGEIEGLIGGVQSSVVGWLVVGDGWLMVVGE